MAKCPLSTVTPVYDDIFFRAIERCPKTPALAYCQCYDNEALASAIRSQESIVNDKRTEAERARDKYNDARKLYPKMTEVPGPSLNVPSRADQKANVFTKAFDPKNRKIIVLVIASFLIFLAVINYD